MGPSLPALEAQALETIENVLAALRRIHDRDPALNTLIEAIEDDYARLIANLMGSRLTGRAPQKISTTAPLRTPHTPRRRGNAT